MDRSSSGFQEAADEPDERGFTTPIGAADKKEFAIGDGEVNAFQSTGSVRIMMMKIFDFDHNLFIHLVIPAKAGIYRFS
jgi:hypothetical protein